MMKAFLNCDQNHIRKAKQKSKNTSDSPEPLPAGEIFQIADQFKSLLSTIILFLEQDPLTNVSMNLDVNFRRVHQENFLKAEGTTIKDAIFKEGDDTFQNSAIHLLFYETIVCSDADFVPTLNESPKPELTSMSFCKFMYLPTLTVDEKAFGLELLLVLQGVTAKFVTKEKYNLLAFILGQRYINSTDSQQCFRE